MPWRIGNNLVENAIRPTAIGKKNVLYTLIGNCHREGINATTYPKDLFTRLPTETNHTVHRLMPKAWPSNKQHCSRLWLTTAAAQ